MKLGGFLCPLVIGDPSVTPRLRDACLGEAALASRERLPRRLEDRLGLAAGVIGGHQYGCIQSRRPPHTACSKVGLCFKLKFMKR